MKKSLLVPVIIAAFVFSAFGQKIEKPKKFPTPATDSQQKLINDGIALHDAKRYDEAIALYDKVLAENPDATMALYEKALSLYTKGDKAKAVETAYLGTKYISDQLALFYGTIANHLDDSGKPDEAIKIYRQAEDMLKGDIGVKHHLSSVYYNLAITYFRQKKYTESRSELKKAVTNNFAYPSPHYLLAVVFNGTKYKIPAFLAAARLVSLEANTQRTVGAVKILADVLKPAPKDPTTGNINIFMNLDAAKDEGDFGMFELLLGTLTVVKGDEDKNKTDNEMYVDAIGTIIAMLAEDKKMSSTFVGKTYVPFMNEMKKSGHVEAFGYFVLSTNGNADASRWVKANDAKIGAFLNWAKAYQLPAK